MEGHCAESKQVQTFPQRFKKKKKKKIYVNLEEAIIKNTHTHTHRSEVRLQFFPSEVTSCFLSKSGDRSVLLHLPSAVVCREAEKQRKERKTGNLHPSSCIGALLGCPELVICQDT